MDKKHKKQDDNNTIDNDKDKDKDKKPIIKNYQLLSIIADEDTCVGFLMGGIGERDSKTRQNFMVVDSKTDLTAIEDCFKSYTKRLDIGIILISQHVANKIRPVVEAHVAVTPTVLEIPTRDHPYKAAMDSILRRAQKLKCVID